jgi:hypothetical protein
VVSRPAESSTFLDCPTIWCGAGKVCRLDECSPGNGWVTSLGCSGLMLLTVPCCSQNAKADEPASVPSFNSQGAENRISGKAPLPLASRVTISSHGACAQSLNPLCCSTARFKRTGAAFQGGQWADYFLARRSKPLLRSRPKRRSGQPIAKFVIL